MSEVNLSEVSQEGVIPNVTRRRVHARVIGAKKGETKAKEPKVDLQLEIFAPESVNDASGNPVIVAGLKASLSLIYKGKGLPGTLQFHTKMGLPLQFDTDSEEFLNMYVGAGLAFEVFLSSEETVLTEMSEDGTKQIPVVDSDTGEPVKGGYRWKTIWASDIGKKVVDPNAV